MRWECCYFDIFSEKRDASICSFIAYDELLNFQQKNETGSCFILDLQFSILGRLRHGYRHHFCHGRHDVLHVFLDRALDIDPPMSPRSRAGLFGFVRVLSWQSRAMDLFSLLRHRIFRGFDRLLGKATEPVCEWLDLGCRLKKWTQFTHF